MVDRLAATGLGSRAMVNIWGWERHVEAMLDVERALILALGSLGILKEETATAAAAMCTIDRIDPVGLAEEAAAAATPVIPLVARIRAEMDVSLADAVHVGATSQDIIDTATALQLRAGLQHIEEQLLAVGDVCAALAERHRDDVMVGRTLGQHAVPITFGLKAARWSAAIGRRIVALRRVRAEQNIVQFGGAAGTLGSFGAAGLAVAEQVALRLDMGLPSLPRHSERDHVADLASALGVIAGVSGRIASDLVMLAQSEVSEVSFGGDAVTSSAMPQKRNPVDAVAARAAARLAMSEALGIMGSVAEHEFERSAGAWQAESVALPSLLVRTAGSLERLLSALVALVPDTDRMRRNLEAAHGLTASEALVRALSPVLGSTAAAEVVTELSREVVLSDRVLQDVALSESRVVDAIGESGIASALDPTASLRSVAEMIDRALEEYRSLRALADEATLPSRSRAGRDIEPGLRPEHAKAVP